MTALRKSLQTRIPWRRTVRTTLPENCPKTCHPGKKNTKTLCLATLAPQRSENCI
jgi:hypothetical protein